MQRRGLEPNTLIRTSEKGEQPEKALYLLEQMHSRGLDPDTIIPRGCSLASLPTFDRYRTCVYEIEGDGVSHLSCTSDRYNIIIYPMTSPCMCSPLEAMSTGRGLGTFPVVVRQCAAVRTCAPHVSKGAQSYGHHTQKLQTRCTRALHARSARQRSGNAQNACKICHHLRSVIDQMDICTRFALTANSRLVRNVSRRVQRCRSV